MYNDRSLQSFFFFLFTKAVSLIPYVSHILKMRDPFPPEGKGEYDFRAVIQHKEGGGISSCSTLVRDTESFLSWGLVEEPKDLSSDVFTTSLLVVHDTSRSGQNNVTERTSGKELLNPVLDLSKLNVESRRDNTTLVNTAVKLNNNLAGTMVIDLLEFTDVTCHP